jgi:hypothetical protein
MSQVQVKIILFDRNRKQKRNNNPNNKKLKFRPQKYNQNNNKNHKRTMKKYRVNSTNCFLWVLLDSNVSKHSEQPTITSIEQFNTLLTEFQRIFLSAKDKVKTVIYLKAE